MDNGNDILLFQTVQPVRGGQRRLAGEHDPLRAEAQLVPHGGAQVIMGGKTYFQNCECRDNKPESNTN